MSTKIEIKKPNVYDLVVRCEIDGNTEDFYFDYVEDTTVNLSADICNHPLVNGDIIADHMYINPSTMSVSGSFSLLGNKKGDRSYNFGTSDRLSNIQNTFERIMRDGIMCTLVKMDSNGNKSRFKVRENMVLTSISWVEHQCSIDFSFTFNEALTAIVDDIGYDLDITDPNLPKIADPVTLDVTDELLDKSEIIKSLIAILRDEHLYSDAFLESAINSAIAVNRQLLRANLSSAVGAAVGGTIAGAAGIATMAIIFGVGSIPGVGWAVIGAVALAGAVIGSIYGIYKGLQKSKYLIKEFKYYKNEKKRDKENQRFYDFIGQIVLQFDQLEQSLSLYGFGKDTSQQCFITIDNNYYIFTFKKSTENSDYSLEVVDIGEKNIANITNVSQKAIASLGECNSSTIAFTTSSGVQVYICNTKVLEKRQLGATNEEINEVQKDLKNYAILVSSIDLYSFNEQMINIIKSQIFK